ncbi:hypothetical protein GCM10010303_19310 [Streptomyces purpurascens]|nr:hypothetical protein GCM10010303_19310 [Streptomyces purpurascens]
MRARTYGLALFAGALLASAACSSPSSGPSQPRADTATRTIRPVQGCGTASWTDPADRAPDRAPARCRPGSPAPQRLTEPRKLTIATGTLSAEYVAPLRVARASSRKRAWTSR